jgi:hypothetical protein
MSLKYARHSSMRIMERQRPTHPIRQQRKFVSAAATIILAQAASQSQYFNLKVLCRTGPWGKENTWGMTKSWGTIKSRGTIKSVGH